MISAMAVPTTTIEGAIYQLAFANSQLCTIADCEPDVDTNRMAEETCRALYSAVKLLGQLAGIDPWSLGIQHFMADYLDPFVESPRQ